MHIKDKIAVSDGIGMKLEDARTPLDKCFDDILAEVNALSLYVGPGFSAVDTILIIEKVQDTVKGLIENERTRQRTGK